MLNDAGCPITPELVTNSHVIVPVAASNARNLRSFVPPLNTRPPPVASIGPQLADVAKVWVQTRLPVSTCQAWTSPIWAAPSASISVELAPVKLRPAV